MSIIYIAVSKTRGLVPVKTETLKRGSCITDLSGRTHGLLDKIRQCPEKTGHFMIITVSGTELPAWDEETYEDIIRQNTCHC